MNELFEDLLCNSFPVANTWNRSSRFPFFAKANVLVVFDVVVVVVIDVVIVVVF